ncbi:MAG: hypothetical protein WDN44_01730 [Sphingomonas sp.]
MLNELRAAHEDLLAALAQLEQLTLQDSPDEAALASTRWQASRASGRRRKIFAAACAFLVDRVSDSDRIEIQTLQDLNATQLKASTAHIGKWTLQQVIDDWSGYQAVSRRMRASVRELVAADRATLCPLLDRTTP